MYDFDEYEERPLIINGYVLTDSAKKLEKYKELQKSEFELVEQCFGGGDGDK